MIGVQKNRRGTLNTALNDTRSDPGKSMLGRSVLSASYVITASSSNTSVTVERAAGTGLLKTCRLVKPLEDCCCPSPTAVTGSRLAEGDDPNLKGPVSGACVAIDGAEVAEPGSRLAEGDDPNLKGPVSGACVAIDGAEVAEPNTSLGRGSLLLPLEELLVLTDAEKSKPRGTAGSPALIPGR